jgi:hypothetical protein
VETSLLDPLDEVRVGRHLGTNHSQERGYGTVAVTLELLLVSIGEILVEEVEVGDIVTFNRNLLSARLKLKPRGYIY